MSDEIIDSILINELQTFDKYEKINPVEIYIKSNNIIADLIQY